MCNATHLNTAQDLHDLQKSAISKQVTVLTFKSASQKTGLKQGTDRTLERVR